jgi:hypothetical protein
MTLAQQIQLHFRVHFEIDNIGFIQQIQNTLRLMLADIASSKIMQVIRSKSLLKKIKILIKLQKKKNF